MKNIAIIFTFTALFVVFTITNAETAEITVKAKISMTLEEPAAVCPGDGHYVGTLAIKSNASLSLDYCEIITKSEGADNFATEETDAANGSLMLIDFYADVRDRIRELQFKIMNCQFTQPGTPDSPGYSITIHENIYVNIPVEQCRR